MDKSIRRKDLLLLLGLLAIVILLIATPYHLLFKNYMSEWSARQVGLIIGGGLTIIFCLFLALRSGIMEKGGFVKGRPSNYWMFIIPLFFPLCLMYSNFTADCFKGVTIFLAFLSTRLVRGIMEEVVFRGIIQGYLIAKYPSMSKRRVCVLAAIFFALIHLINLRHAHPLSVVNQIVFAFYMGLLFGAIVIRTNNVWLSGVVHGLFNLVAMPCSGLEMPELTAIDEAPQFWDWIKNIAGFILIFSPTIIIYRLLLPSEKKKKKLNDEMV